MKKEDVSFIQKGEGKDLVLLHGYLSSKESFSAHIDYFSKTFRVTAIDFCGFGHSAPLTSAFSVSDYAAWTSEAFSLLGVGETPYCIAHSFGCRVAVKMQSLAAENGGKGAFSKGSFGKGAFGKTIFTGPAGLLPKRTLRYKIRVKAYRAAKKLFPAFAEKKFGSAEYRSLSPVMKESYKKIVNEDLRGDIAKFGAPALVIEGDRDTITTAAEAEEYAKLLPRGGLQYISGGHFAFAENAAAFTLAAEEFFSDE